VLYFFGRAARHFDEVRVNDERSEVTTISASIFFQLQEEERYRLARALMDGPGQILANALFELEHSLPLIESDPAAAHFGIYALRSEIRTGLAQLKMFVAELQPPLLAEMGLGPSLGHYVNNFGAQNGLASDCRGCDALAGRLPTTIETTLFRIVQEALDNVRDHAQATKVQVELEVINDQLRLVIEDNGKGFLPRNETSPKRRQLGLVAMRDRAALVGGQLQIFSESGHGTRVVVTVPYHGREQATANEEHENRTGGKHEDDHKLESADKSPDARRDESQRSPTSAGHSGKGHKTVDASRSRATG
jgi:signal transduction histidine kinase